MRPCPTAAFRALPGLDHDLDGVAGPEVAAVRAGFLAACARWRRDDGGIACTMATRLDSLYEEIARVTGAALGTVRSRIHYAKRALRRALEGK